MPACAQHKETSDEATLKKFACRPRHIWWSMLTTEFRPTCTSLDMIQSCPRQDLGQLDSLPLELIYAIFAQLDVQSLMNLSRTCLRAVEVLRNFSEYRALFRHAPEPIAALHFTQLLDYHPISALYTALTSSKCSNCDHFGTILFLPTCQRCCFNCLTRDPTFWLVPQREAIEAFPMLQTGDSSRLQVPLLPGQYRENGYWSRYKPYYYTFKAFSVRAAKEFAMKKVEHLDQLIAGLDRRIVDGRLDDECDFDELRGIVRAPLGPEISGETRQSVGNAHDGFPGMASIPFPYLDKDGNVENGLWCAGCFKRACGDPFKSAREEPLDRESRAKGYRARTRAEFLEHVECCERVQLIESKTFGEAGEKSLHLDPHTKVNRSGITDAAIVKWVS